MNHNALRAWRGFAVLRKSKALNLLGLHREIAPNLLLDVVKFECSRTRVQVGSEGVRPKRNMKI